MNLLLSIHLSNLFIISLLIHVTICLFVSLLIAVGFVVLWLDTLQDTPWRTKAVTENSPSAGYLKRIVWARAEVYVCSFYCFRFFNVFFVDPCVSLFLIFIVVCLLFVWSAIYKLSKVWICKKIILINLTATCNNTRLWQKGLATINIY